MGNIAVVLRHPPNYMGFLVSLWKAILVVIAKHFHFVGKKSNRIMSYDVKKNVNFYYGHDTLYITGHILKKKASPA